MYSYDNSLHFDRQYFVMSQTQIQWLPLRLNNLPLVHKQTLAILDKFLLTRADLLDGDILALDALKNINSSVKVRIKDVEQFYMSRPMDPRMKHLFGIQIVLKQIGEGCQQFQGQYDKYNILNEDVALETHNSPTKQHQNYRNLEEDQIFSSKITPIEMGQLTPSYNIVTPSSKSQREEKKPQFRDYHKKQQQPIRLSDLKKPKLASKPKTPTKTADPYKKGSSKKVEPAPQRATAARSEHVNQMQKERREAASRLQTQEVKKSFRDLSDLVFTIKMTKEEYNDFMRLKRKNNHA